MIAQPQKTEEIGKLAILSLFTKYMYNSRALSVLHANSSGMMALLCLLCKEGIWTCDQQHLRHLLLHASPLTQSALVAKVVVFCFLRRMLQAS